MTRSAHTRMLALLGHPIAHSRSPSMMQRTLDELAVDAQYLAFDVAPERLGDAVRGLRALGFAGANVTVPHKRAVLSFCDEADPLARACGAANTLVPHADGRLIGCNTDAPAAVAALTNAGVELHGARVLLFGAGGAARAVAVGCAEARAHSVHVVARERSAAEEVAHAATRAPRVLGVKSFATGALAWGDDAAVREAAAEATVLVQCTTLGMQRDGATVSTANAERDAHDEDLLVEWAHAAKRKCAAMDLVYSPRETRFLSAARARGLHHVVDGLGMLVHQAALALSHWFAVDPGRAAALLRRSLDAP